MVEIGGRILLIPGEISYFYMDVVLNTADLTYEQTSSYIFCHYYDLPFYCLFFIISSI